ncbi:hypothetical protein K435DRAFT_916034 [Dendrothele bispora CBS 962.96]|uniref:Uncharacterized protein n=1 Tax=Dendrothele bispora (strain CBS 962.96) TaxID=1314807 RepID=A0A4S8LIJ2_DENBC|nr:hypothetical protein K435DRAFT_916034 [Dendrothele bispora CBS 962.96]
MPGEDGGGSFQAKLFFACSSAYCCVLQSLQEVSLFKSKCPFLFLCSLLYVVIPALAVVFVVVGESLQAKNWHNNNSFQDDEDRFKDLSDSSDDDTNNEEIATDSDMMDVDPPVMPQSLGLLQTPAAFSDAHADLMDVDN